MSTSYENKRYNEVMSKSVKDRASTPIRPGTPERVKNAILQAREQQKKVSGTGRSVKKLEIPASKKPAESKDAITVKAGKLDESSGRKSQWKDKKWKNKEKPEKKYSGKNDRTVLEQFKSGTIKAVPNAILGAIAITLMSRMGYSRTGRNVGVVGSAMVNSANGKISALSKAEQKLVNNYRKAEIQNAEKAQAHFAHRPTSPTDERNAEFLQYAFEGRPISTAPTLDETHRSLAYDHMIPIGSGGRRGIIIDTPEGSYAFLANKTVDHKTSLIDQIEIPSPILAARDSDPDRYWEFLGDFFFQSAQRFR